MRWMEKTIGYLGLEGLFADSRHDRANFRTNMVTLADYHDSGVGSASSVMGLAAAWACVRLVSGTISSLPLVVYRQGPKGREADTRHPLYKILHDRPNADQTTLNFLQFISASIELQGNAYAEVQRASDGRVIAIAPPFAPELVRPKRTRFGAIEYEIGGTDPRTIPQDRMLHIRGFGGNPLGGLSTLAYGRHVFGMAGAVERAAAATFRNGVKTSGAISTERILTKPQHDELSQIVDDQFKGAHNAGRPFILHGGMKWNSISINPDDAQMLESRAFSVEEICRIFGVPPHMIGHTASTTSFGNGIEQMTIGFIQFTLRERLKNIESTLELALLSPVERDAGMRIEFNIDGLLRGDSAARSALYSAGLKDKWLTVNEVRAKENLLPVSWGDRPWGQMQDTQLNELGQVVPVKPEAA